MSFQPSDPTSGFTSPDGWEPHDDAAAIGAILRGEGEPSEEPPPAEDPTVNVVGSFRRAFPGGGDVLPAMGAGATALSGADRANVIIYQVTNRDDSGAGSFRQAMLDAWLEEDQDALKIIVFRTGGYIDLTSTIQIPRFSTITEATKRIRNLYIAGQTAPGDGICFRMVNHPGPILDFYGWTCEDIVIRGTRFRYGYYENASSSDGNLRFYQCLRLMIDSSSFSWAPGRQIHIGAQNVGRSLLAQEGTIQNCMLYEAFWPHSTALSNWLADGDDIGKKGDIDGKIATVYRNFMGSSQRRAPHTGTYCEIVNNITWNMREDCGWIQSTGRIVDYLGNILVDGPHTESVNRLQPFGLRGVEALFGGTANAYAEGWYPSYFLEKNLWRARPGSGNPDKLTDTAADNWSNDIPGRSGGARQGLVDGWGSNEQAYLDTHLSAGTSGWTGLLEFRRNKRLWEIVSGDREWGVCEHRGEPVFPITVDDPYDVEQEVKDNVGHAWRVNAAGQWVRDRRDAVDARQITELESGNAIVTSIEKLRDPKTTMDARFVYPVLSAGTAPTDSNGDGIPDAYYTAMGYDPTGASRAGEIGHDGYCFAENWINGRDHHTGAMRFG